jgi:16S rRNA (guanine527-N7)-methyltransferase
LQADDGILLAMKGQIPAQELAELSEIYRVIPISVPGIDAERCLIELERTLHG